MPLSELTIRHARITCKNYTVGDFDGLSLGASLKSALRMEQLPELLSKIRNYGGHLQTKLGLRLLLLTGVRTGELRYATPDQFDLEKQLWVIPPEVVKQLQVKMRRP